MKAGRIALICAICLGAIQFAVVSWLGSLIANYWPKSAVMVAASAAALVSFILCWLSLRYAANRLSKARSEGDRAAEQARRQVERLESLRRIDLAINSNVDLRYLFQVFLREVTSQLKVDAADILIFNPKTQTLEHAASQGFRTDGITKSNQRIGDGLAGRAALERKIVHEPDIPKATTLYHGELIDGEDFVCYFGVPLVARGQVRGVLEVLHRSPIVPDSSWLSFLEAMAGQAAIAIENAAMLDELQRSHTELKLAYDHTLEGWVKALDLRDKETEGHTQRVTEMTVRLAKAVGVSADDIEHIRRGALLHDIGKIGIPDDILHKPGKLTEEEWVVMRKHPVYAFEWLSPVSYLRKALDIPYCHHEKWDGSGYPRGLKGEEIPLSARIFAVVDVWDALRSDRPYRAGWPIAEVRKYLEDNAGSHFDASIVEVFMREILVDEGEVSIAA